VSALRGVTIDIYDNASDHRLVDSANETFSNFSTNLKASAGRLGRMARSGDKVAVFKLAAMIVGVVVVLWIGWGLVFGR
jgi:blocked early in transport 1